MYITIHVRFLLSEIDRNTMIISHVAILAQGFLITMEEVARSCCTRSCALYKHPQTNVRHNFKLLLVKQDTRISDLTITMCPSLLTFIWSVTIILANNHSRSICKIDGRLKRSFCREASLSAYHGNQGSASSDRCCQHSKSKRRMRIVVLSVWLIPCRSK